MTTKIQYGLVALAAITVMSFGMTPAFAANTHTLTLMHGAGEGTDVRQEFVGGMCDGRDIANFQVWVANNGSWSNKVTTTADLNRGNNSCQDLDHFTVTVYAGLNKIVDETFYNESGGTVDYGVLPTSGTYAVTATWAVYLD